MSIAKRSAIRVVAGTATAQGVTLLSSLAVARLYYPEAFGTFAVISSVISVLGIVAALRIEAAIPVPVADASAMAISRAAVTLSGTAALSTGVVVLFWRQPIARILSVAPDDSMLLWFVPPAIFLSGLSLGFNQLALRARRYGIVSTSVVLQALAMAVAQIAGGYYVAEAIALLAGFIVGQLASVLTLLPSSEAMWPLSLRDLRSLLGQFRDFTLVLAPATLINTLGLQLPLLLGGILYGAAFTGWFGMTQRFLAVPVTLMGSSLGKVFLGEFSAMIRGGSMHLYATFRKASLYLMLAGLIAGGGVALFGPILFAWLLGDEYRMAGEYARALSAGLALQMLAAPLTSLLILLRRQAIQAVWDLTRLFIIAASMVIAWRSHLSPFEMLFAISIVQSGMYVVLWFLIRRALLRAASVRHGSINALIDNSRDHPEGVV